MKRRAATLALASRSPPWPPRPPLLERRLGRRRQRRGGVLQRQPGRHPHATATGRAVTVSWAASTLANGQAVNGYEVRRYDAGTRPLQTILSACTGTITATSCVESRVPAGRGTTR